MDTALVTRLSGPEGSEIFEQLSGSYERDKALRAGTRLRAAGYSAELITAALTQWELRTRAGAKFGADAGRMFFTRDGLEQSTRGLVADLHAQRLVDCGVRHVWDLGCGIGGDAMAFRRAGLDVTAVEADPLTAAVARANLATVSSAADGAMGSGTVRTGFLEDTLYEMANAAGQYHAVWLDPARRSPGVSDVSGRTRRIRSREEMSPPWDVVERAARTVPAAGVKVGASFNADSLPGDIEAQWVSVNGATLECALWWGEASRAAISRSASVHREGLWSHLVTPSPEHLDHSPVMESVTRQDLTAGCFVYEVDSAVLAAGMRDLVCADVGGLRLGMAAYVWSTRQVTTPWARCWQVSEVLPLSVKPLRAWARRHDVGALTLKKPPSRSHSPIARLDPDALRTKIAPKGSTAATLVLTEIDDRGATAALAVNPAVRAR
ncbi:MAG: class I SAM-dependent methyltransferase [Ornithinimicrobium sp.]